MTNQMYRHLGVMTLLTLVFGLLAAQPYQKLHAYDLGNGPLTGSYFDVVNLSSAAPNAGASMAIGHGFLTPNRGVLTEILVNGNANQTWEVDNPNGPPVVAKAIGRMPNDDIIACYFDPANGATDVIRYSLSAGVVWTQRLPSFRVEDVVCDSANVATGEGIWLTGQSTVSGRLVVEGLSGAGASMFATDYNLFSPNWTYQSAKGFQLQLNAARTHLTVVGTANIAGVAQTEMLLLRITVAGGFIWAKGYGDTAGNDFYHGKCLVLRPGTGSRFVVGFEYSGLAQPYDQVAAMHVDAFGNPAWVRAYPGAGFFTGTDYIVEDIDVLGNRLLLAGYFDPAAAAGPNKAAYSLALRLSGAAVQFNEYEATGNYPTGETTFHGMDYNAVSNHHVMVGKFTTSSTAGTWPWSVDPNAFWAVGADQLGIANCSQSAVPQPVALTPVVSTLTSQTVNMPQPQQSPLVVQNTDPKFNSQCGPMKRGGFAAEEVSSVSLRIAYDAAARQITLEVPQELSGTGTVRLLNLQGQVLMELDAQRGAMQLDAQQLSQGVYLLQYELPGIASGAQKVILW